MIDEAIEAAGRGDLVGVEAYLGRGLDINMTTAHLKQTLLIAATRGCHVSLMRVLLDRGADMLPQNSVGWTALTYALFRSRIWERYWERHVPDPRPLELLLSRGGQYRLLEAVMSNDIELARARLDEGAEVNTGEWTYYGTVLQVAAELGYLEIVDLLLDRDARIEATDDLGQRPLLAAARFGWTEVVCRLLDRGAELNAVDWSGQSALANAAAMGHHDLFEQLLARGAERTIVDALVLGDVKRLESLLDEKLRSVEDIDRISGGEARIAMLAVSRGNPDIVRLMLSRGARHLHERYDRHSLLAEAARNGHGTLVQLLIEKGADLHAIGRDGLTPFAWAVNEGQTEIAEQLSLAGANH